MDQAQRLPFPEPSSGDKGAAGALQGDGSSLGGDTKIGEERKVTDKLSKEETLKKAADYFFGGYS